MSDAGHATIIPVCGVTTSAKKLAFDTLYDWPASETGNNALELTDVFSGKDTIAELFKETIGFHCNPSK